MKKKNLICIVLCFVLLLCSCSKTAEKEPAVLDTYVPSETELNGAPEKEPKSQEAQPEETKKEEKPAEEPKKELPGLKLLSKEETEAGTVVRYEDQDWGRISEQHLENATTTGWNNKFSTIAGKMKYYEGSIVVVGYATGIREGYCNKAYTKTEFVVENVLYGEETRNTIVLREEYVYRSEDGKNYFFSVNSYHTQLKNNQRVLLFLRKNKYDPNAYTPCWFEIAVPADYMDYNEEYFSELLDYYRGDRSVYQENPQDSQMEYIFQEDGTTEVVYTGTVIYYWPEREISDEALLEELDENILIQAAMRYKVKILPCYHKDNAGRYSTYGLSIISNPHN